MHPEIKDVSAKRDKARKCPHCGKASLKQDDTSPLYGGFVRRYFVCKACSGRCKTVEGLPVSTQ